MSARRTRFYLDKRNGKFLGVCSGIADYSGIDATWVRVGVVLLTLAALGPIGPLAYLILAWVADDKPREFYEASAEDDRFWQKVRVKPANSVRDVRSRFRDVDRRLGDVEAHIVSSNSRLAREIESLR